MEAGGTARRIRSGSSNNGHSLLAANLLILVVLLCWSSTWILSCRAWDCSSSDRTTLLDFKSGFVDVDGVFSTWNASTNCCTWSGVTCRESDGAVLALTLIGTSGNSNNQAYRDASYTGGTVGAVLISLSSLQNLTIQWVLFDGPIPLQWRQFSSNLEVIIVNNANLRDDIPSGLASIPNLQKLDLKSNHLTGAIPADFCYRDRSVEYIDVSYNDMNYLLVPTCLQQESSNGNVSVVYNSQGQSSSPGAPVLGAGVSVIPSFVVFAFGALSSAILLRNLL